MRSKKRLSDSRRYFVEGMNIREHSQNTKQKKAEELEKLAEECLAPKKKDWKSEGKTCFSPVIRKKGNGSF